MEILDDKGVSKLSAKVFFFKVNNSFKKIDIDYKGQVLTKEMHLQQLLEND